MKKKTLVILISLACFLLLAAVGTALGMHIYQNRELEKQILLQQEEQLNRDRAAAFSSLADEEYSSVFFSMFSTPYILEEYFQHYVGSPTLKQEYAFRTTEEINMALDIVFSSGNDVNNIYLGLDPFLLYHTANDDVYELEAALESGLFSHADDHPETIFQVILAFPSLNYWQSISEGKFRISLVLYRMLVDLLNTRENIVVYFPGNQEWLLDNPANYISDFVLESTAAHKVILLIISGQLQINEDNKDEMLRQFSNLLLSRREAPLEYPDLSQWEIIFFGDSIIGNYDGSLSIPGAVNGLSDATVYNCARGGVSATSPASSESYSFPTMAEFFVSGDDRDIPDDNFGQGTREYRLAKHTVKKRCIIINYGLNDYFCGYLIDNPENIYDTATYAGAMRTGIATLKKRYPNALYVIMGPGQITNFDNGTSLQGDSMEPLTTYSDCAKALSEELGTLYIDLYNDFTNDEITVTDVLSDTVHYNEYGRYLVAIKIIDLLGRQPMSKQALQPAISIQ